MICSNCGSENKPGAKFCNDCGTALASGCPNCGAVNKPGAKFCNECGASLTGAEVGPPSSVTSAESNSERRLVTVLFADIVGFTPFAEERDAEEVRETLTHYFELCSDVVGRYGGTIEKFIGDAVMAVWGAPTAHEDDAERAVRAALELVDAVHVLGEQISARAGVLTGEAAVTLGATNQGIVAGDLVNTAARLQSAAAPGTVLVGEATQRATSAAIAYETAGQHELKGKLGPIPAWRAQRVVAERGGRNRSEGLEAPFVGRANELRMLKDLLHATGREKRARLVSVMGPAGIGKSRLAWEFLKYIDGLVESVYWHSGRSPAYGEGITFWALGEMIRGRCGLVEGDNEETTRGKVADTVANWVTDGEERKWVERSLLTLLGVESGMSPEQLFGAWRTFFERISEQGTVVLVFEDLHFADSGTLHFIDHLLEWSRSQPIYLVTLARPELLDQRPDWGAGKRSFNSIVLEQLRPDEMSELLAGLVPGLPDQAARAIIERADGIPLYAVETVRMLLADGRLEQHDGNFVPVGDLRDLAVPDTLTALISSRLDALDGIDRSLLQDGAVIGQSFTVPALAAVSGTPENEVQERLGGLVRRELLGQEIDARSPERGQYVFVQALIREVAYNTLSRKDRKARHLAAARYFEQVGSDELAGALAGHYVAARANAQAGPEADALATQARLALRGAAERAAKLGAYAQAARFYEQALEITINPAEQAELLENAGVAARTAGSYIESERLLRQAMQLRRGLGDRVATARAVAALGLTLNDGFRDDAAMELLDAAAAEFADLMPDPVVAEIGVQLARSSMQKNDLRRALQVAEAILETAEPRDLMQLVAQALIIKGSALGQSGRKLEGIALIEAGGHIAREHGFDDIALGSFIVGGFNKGDTDLQAAMQSYRDGAVMARRVGQRGRLLALINNLGYTGFLTGDWDDALAEMDGALSEELDYKDRISILCNASIVHAARGEPIDDALDEVMRLGAAIPGEGWHSVFQDPEGNRALAQGKPAEAGRFWRRLAELEPGQANEFMYRAAVAELWAGERASVLEALAAMDATGVHGRVATARRLTVVAGLAVSEGRIAEAAALYAEALAAWRDLRVAWDEALTGITMVKLLDPDTPEVRRVAASTREILLRLGATPYVEQLDEALGRSDSAAEPDIASSPHRVTAA